MFRRLVTSKETKEYRGTIDYPSGCVLDDGENKFLVKSNGLYRFGSERVFDSWSFMAGTCLPENIEHLPVVGVLGFREGSLLSKFSDGTLHVVSNNKTRHLVSPDALDKYGLFGRPIYEVSDNEFNLHDKGEPLDA